MSAASVDAGIRSAGIVIVTVNKLRNTLTSHADIVGAWIIVIAYYRSKYAAVRSAGIRSAGVVIIAGYLGMLA